MAKSIRSKWKRKCRAIKRERYREKELLRLKKTLENESNSKVTKIDNIKQQVNVVTAQQIRDSGSLEDNLVDMEEVKKQFNPKTLRDKHGAYPIWVHPRKIKSSKKKNKKKGKKK
ncbi:protein LLP homolog [Rhynchophorus ferrugineus]|uniref:Protein LLP homolog n=1 Tax=Rhynchophorus ferrugineus TaxID=354439 RepID=A0A834IEN2_RHYFE|nr:hypothetical protein GWI33_014692 [Rhynchophorus ferrugineus]